MFGFSEEVSEKPLFNIQRYWILRLEYPASQDSGKVAKRGKKERKGEVALCQAHGNTVWKATQIRRLTPESE